MDESIKIWFKEDFKDFDSTNGLNRERPFELKRLNVLVGANNSGKSRFMRNIISKVHNKDLNLHITDNIKSNLDEIDNEFLRLTSTTLSISNLAPIDLESLLQKLRDAINLITTINTDFEEWHNGSTKYPMGPPENLLKIRSSLPVGHRHFNKAEELINAISRVRDDLNSNILNQPQVFYLNSLRSLKKLTSNIKVDEELKQPLVLRVHSDYNFSMKQIISGEEFFDLLTDSLLGKPDERQRIQEYQKKLSHYFFNNETITIIPHLKTDSIEIKIGDEEL